MALSEQPTRPPESASRPRKALTIGAVCKILQNEFDDVSISKIRYLEDQKLLSPRRTSGGYRLYSQADVERLRTILRLQRDEFLPLRVIRQELAAGNEIGIADSNERRPSSGSVRRAILVAMEDGGVRRYIGVSAAPVVPFGEDEGLLFRTVAVPLVRRALRRVYADLAVMEDVVRSSGLEWTLVRPPRLTDAPAKGTYRRTIGANVPRESTS